MSSFAFKKCYKNVLILWALTNFIFDIPAKYIWNVFEPAVFIQIFHPQYLHLPVKLQ